MSDLLDLVQKQRTFSGKTDYYQRIRNRHRLSSTWAVYQVDDFDQLHPFSGIRELVYDCDWGLSQLVKIDGNTWLDLYYAADRCVVRSGDEYNCCIKQFQTNPNNPRQLFLITSNTI